MTYFGKCGDITSILVNMNTEKGARMKKRTSGKSKAKPIKAKNTSDMIYETMKTHRFKIIGIAVLACGFYFL